MNEMGFFPLKQKKEKRENDDWVRGEEHLILPRWSRAALYGTTTDMWLFQNAASLERSFNAFQAEAARPLGGGGVTPLEQLDEPKLSGVVAGPK